MRAQAYRNAAIKIVALVLLSSIAWSAKAEFTFLSESAVFNPSNQEVVFTIVFNQAPDFFTIDSNGRQANSFQYYIVGDPNLPYPSKFDAIIRGEEIHITSNVIRIRNSPPTDSSPEAGGWGSIRGTVPYKIKGNVLTFSTPLQLISNQSRDGHFDYELESYQFGTSTLNVASQSRVAPQPTTMGQCKNKNWQAYHFKSQRQCIQYVNTRNGRNHRDK